MTLRTRIVGVAVSSVFITTAAGLLIQRSVVRKQGIEMIRDTMRTVVLGAEDTRQSFSAMRAAGMFDDARLKAEAASVSDYRRTNIYKTVPVVAAWESIAQIAAKQGYEFRVPAENPRNPKNLPRADEERILRLVMDKQLPEYFEVDDKAGELIYARPIVLAGDCLPCHGDPANSPTKDGRDMLGFRMEGWHAGDRHGMFLLRSKLDRVDEVVKAGMGQTMLWLLPLSLLIGAGVYVVVSRISNQIRGLTHAAAGSSAEIASAVERIAESSQTMAQGATEQAASLEQTSAAAEEISGMTSTNAENARQAAAEMKHVDRQVKESNTTLGAMIASMKEIMDSSQKIGGIIKVIDEIAFQTNILALNAAVEAARAGAAGAGFAVVADEVRNLAQRSAQAAKDTAPLIEESLNKSNAGGVSLEKVAAAFRGITESANKVKVLIDNVNHGSDEQAHGIEQILKAMQEASCVTQNNAAHSEESASTSEELASQAEAMNGIALRLQNIIEG